MRTLISATLWLIGSLTVPLLVAPSTTHAQGQEPESFLDLGSVRDELAIVPRPGVAAARLSVAEGLTVAGNDVVANFRLLRLLEGGGERIVEYGDSLQPGDKATLEFNVKRDGFVSIWSLDANKAPKRLVPNKFMLRDGTNGVPVRSGASYRIDGRGMLENDERLGNPEREWHLVAKEPYGTAEVLLRWTESLKLQPPGDAFVDLSAFDKEVSRVTRAAPVKAWTSLVIHYQVVSRGAGTETGKP